MSPTSIFTICFVAFWGLIISHAIALLGGWILGTKVDPHIMLSNPKKSKEKDQKDMQSDEGFYDDQIIDGTEKWTE